MSNRAKVLVVCGAILTILGCFLPWKKQGDFISALTYGIHISELSFEDNGGLLIILLSSWVLVCNIKPPHFITKPLIVSIALGSALSIVSALQIFMVFVSRIQTSGDIGAPIIGTGLVMTSFGSILILWVSWLRYKQAIQNPAENA